jgi:hypothetical protein
MSNFNHKALHLKDEKQLVYTAMSKHLFYYRAQISTFVLKEGGVPLNPFMILDYFLNDAVDRDVVREANNNLVRVSEQIWVFGAISDGVLAEVIQAKEQGKKIRYFKVIKSKDIVEVDKSDVEMEDEVKNERSKL